MIRVTSLDDLAKGNTITLTGNGANSLLFTQRHGKETIQNESQTKKDTLERFHLNPGKHNAKGCSQGQICMGAGGSMAPGPDIPGGPFLKLKEKKI